MLKGLAIDNGMDKAFELCYKKVAENPDNRVLIDIESGWPYIVSKEYYDAYMQMWEDLKPKNFDSKLSGKIVVYGTGGGHNNDDFNDFFYKGE